jgi:hypothetical protein
VADPRRQKSTEYSLAHLVGSGLFMLMAAIGSRLQHAEEVLQPGFLRALCRLVGCDERQAAHPGSVNHLLMRLPPGELQKLNRALVRRLLRMRCLERYRFGKEWLVAVDGVVIRKYREEHCPRCLHRTLSNGRELYFHAVLEAKLILANGMVISLGSVPILNPEGKYVKQDCELAAFPRLAEQLKRQFPKLPIRLLLDSLYGCEPVWKLCRQMGWSHITVLKKGRTPGLWKRACEACGRHPRNTLSLKLLKRHRQTVQTFRWAAGLKHGGETVHAIFCDQTTQAGKLTHWAWATDHRPDRHTVHILANKGGRLRWRIENQGFNVQKNGGIRLRHDYGSQGHAWYNYYLLAQIAHLLLQLCWLGNLVSLLSGKAFETMKQAFGTLRNFTVRLHAAVPAATAADPCADFDPAAIQIRFSSA